MSYEHILEVQEIYGIVVCMDWFADDNDDADIEPGQFQNCMRLTSGFYLGIITCRNSCASMNPSPSILVIRDGDGILNTNDIKHNDIRQFP